MGRWSHLLAGILYLGVQAASVLHSDTPLPTVCSACASDTDQPAWACADDGCQDPTHHHHRHDPHHQPGTCRICTSGEAAIAEGHAIVEVLLSAVIRFSDPGRAAEPQSIPGHSSRAPPATDPFPA